uniref:hypothetical protein n=1 Tax=Nonomuraea sp. CA-251285 TaxID=3240002 RepID=UPI003F497F96
MSERKQNTSTPAVQVTSRVAVITPVEGIQPGTGLYRINYFVNGQPDGGSLALPHELDGWRADLEAGGWTVRDDSPA